jgi:hypothetical protein
MKNSSLRERKIALAGYKIARSISGESLPTKRPRRKPLCAFPLAPRPNLVLRRNGH